MRPLYQLPLLNLCRTIAENKSPYPSKLTRCSRLLRLRLDASRHNGKCKHKSRWEELFRDVLRANPCELSEATPQRMLCLLHLQYRGQHEGSTSKTSSSLHAQSLILLYFGLQIADASDFMWLGYVFTDLLVGVNPGSCQRRGCSNSQSSPSHRGGCGGKVAKCCSLRSLSTRWEVIPGNLSVAEVSEDPLWPSRTRTRSLDSGKVFAWLVTAS